MEKYREVALDEERTRFALFFPSGNVLLQMANGTRIDLTPEQAMHLANAILARSQQPPDCEQDTADAIYDLLKANEIGLVDFRKDEL